MTRALRILFLAGPPVLYGAAAWADGWTIAAPMPSSRRDLAAAGGVLHGISTLYAIGGHGFDFPLTMVEVFIP